MWCLVKRLGVRKKLKIVDTAVSHRPKTYLYQRGRSTEWPLFLFPSFGAAGPVRPPLQGGLPPFRGNRKIFYKVLNSPLRYVDKYSKGESNMRTVSLILAVSTILVSIGCTTIPVNKVTLTAVPSSDKYEVSLEFGYWTGTTVYDIVYMKTAFIVSIQMISFLLFYGGIFCWMVGFFNRMFLTFLLPNV